MHPRSEHRNDAVRGACQIAGAGSTSWRVFELVSLVTPVRGMFPHIENVDCEENAKCFITLQLPMVFFTIKTTVRPSTDLERYHEGKSESSC